MIKFNMRGDDKTEAFLKDLPHGAKKIALPEISKYLVGNDAHGLRHYPPKQGQKYERTYTLKNGWTISGGTYREKITNSVPYAPHVPNRWAHYGWRQWADVLSSNMDGAMRSARARVGEWLRSK